MRLNQLIHYNPLLGRSLMDTDIDQFLGGQDSLEMAKNTWMPAVDIKETAKEFLVKADVPGMSRENIDVCVDNHILTIRGKREFEEKEEKKNFIRTECFQGEFYRQFTLPETINEEKVTATCKDGVLMITLPKQTKGKKEGSKKIRIQ